MNANFCMEFLPINLGQIDSIIQSGTQFPKAEPTLYKPCDFDWEPFMISDQNLLSPGRQISNIDFPTLYPYSQASVTTQPTQQSHLASHLLNPSSQNIQIFDPSPNSDSYCSSNQSTQPDSSVSPDPHTLPRQNPKKKTKSHPCPSCARSFVRSSDLQRHFSNIHLQIRHHCAIPFCGNNGGKGYCRVEKLQRHLRKQHKLFVIG